MKNYLNKVLFLLIVFTISNKAQSQLNVSSEVGVMFGVTSFQTDFGVSHDFPSANQQTMGYGIAHYLKFFGKKYSWRSGSTFFSEHFMMKTEFMYLNNTNIEHANNPTSDILKDMRGNIKMFNLGNQFEYYFFNIEDYAISYRDRRSFNPYISLGVHYSWFTPNVTTTNDSGSFLVNSEYDKWLTAEQAEELGKTQTIFNESGSAFGVSAGAGLRYSMEYFDLILDSRYQYFFSDKVDGLDAPKDPANKHNDTMIYVNLGVVYTFAD